MQIVKGIPAALVPEAVELLLEAFPLKVEHELRPRSPEQARRVLSAQIVPELGWMALSSGGAAVGLAGVGVHGRRFLGMTCRAYAKEFGWLGGVSRWLSAETEAAIARPKRLQWRVEWLAVSEAARGTGVGTKLLRTVISAAMDEGMKSVKLEVIDVNYGAIRLYEKLGFRRVFTLRTGRFTARAGYRAAHYMRIDLPRR